MKDSFILYTEQKEVIDKLSDEQAGKLIKAIYEYVETEKMPELDPLLDIVIIPFKQNLDRNKEKYNKISEIRAKAGAKGGKQKKQKQTKESKCNDNDNENVNDNDNDNENENVNVNESALYDADVEKIDSLFIETMGSTNISNIQECIKYLDNLPVEVIEHALRKTARKGAKWDYAMTILDSYVEKNLNTLEKVQADEIEFKNKTNKNTESTETEEEKTKRKIKELEEAMNANR